MASTSASELARLAPPSTTAIATATAIVAGLGGYYLGQARSLFPVGARWRVGGGGPATTMRGRGRRRRPRLRPDSASAASSSSRSDSDRVDEDSDEDMEVDVDEPTLEDSRLSSSARHTPKTKPKPKPTSSHAHAAAAADNADHDDEEHKLVLVVRTDLGMSRGKIAAQCGHATLACYKAMLGSHSGRDRARLERWERQGQTKIAVRAQTEEELVRLQRVAARLGVCARPVRDAGRTQIAAGSLTVLGLGPGPKSLVDQVSGGLKLL
ncbi:MAG: hypothetical protein M1826_007493 [Phylliscum demangeonii]|nr:MAG: hypothetical protein M1826_007493 [Phylliscum demangeonii]